MTLILPEGERACPPKGGALSATAEPTDLPDRVLPIEPMRRLAAACTGRLGYPDTHAVSVARCADRIAEQLELDDVSRRAIVEGALLHDIGKVMVDRRVLDKGGPLDAAEWQQVSTHPAEGERLVRGAVDGAVANVVRSHHERWDGSGYPDRLAAEEIPLPARVVAVADAFLAMLEDRPYRTALPLAVALEELETCAGSQFDPRCVDALTAVVASGPPT